MDPQAGDPQEGEEMNAPIEQVLKRLEDCLRVQSAILEQSEELGWILKDVLADLVLALHDEPFIPQKVKEESEKPSETENLKDTKEGVSG